MHRPKPEQRLAVVEHLMTLRDECKAENLTSECAVISFAITAVRYFHINPVPGTRHDLALRQKVKKTIATMQKALQSEFGDDPK